MSVILDAVEHCWLNSGSFDVTMSIDNGGGNKFWSTDVGMNNDMFTMNNENFAITTIYIKLNLKIHRIPTNQITTIAIPWFFTFHRINHGHVQNSSNSDQSNEIH